MATELPKKPLSRKEQYFHRLATGTGELPPEPLSRNEQYLAYLCENGIAGNKGGDAGIEIGNASFGIIEEGKDFVFVPVKTEKGE